MTNTNDHRVKKTKKLLQETLATMIIEKNIHNITIKELTTKADVHRSTFYAHYEDIYDLYNEIENNVISDLSWLIETNFSLDLNVYYQILFDYVHQNKKFCKMLFSNHVNPSFSDRLLALFLKMLD